MPRPIRARIALFLVIAVGGVGYAGWHYAGLDRLFGASGYLVTVELPRGGGIFPGAEVTYRGVGVGRVNELRLTADAVEAVLDIDPAAARIPASATAVVTNRSAIGEQYLDLRPDTAAGPYLAEGSRIGAADTVLPPSPDQLLASADALLRSVPVDSLRTVLGELDTALSGAGPQLRRILDATGSLLPEAVRHLPQTTGLLADGRVVLDTQRDLAEPIASFGADLRALSRQLRESDPDIRELINAGPRVARQVRSVLAESGSDFSVLLANLLTTAMVYETRVDGLEQAMVAYAYLPVIGNALFPGDGTAHLGLVLTVFDPPSCTKGYEGTRQRPGSATTEVPPNSDAYCAEPPGSPIGVRGSQNAPYGGAPRPATAPPASEPGTARPDIPGPLGAPGGAGFAGLGALLGVAG
nr:MCE family protein [Amycolatopsis aidingensis]